MLAGLQPEHSYYAKLGDNQKRNCVLHSQGIWNGDAIMVNPIEIEGGRTPGHTIHDVTLRDCTLPQDASIRLAMYDELTLQNIHSAAE